MVYRIYVEKKPAYAVEAKGILHEIRHLLRIKSVTGLRLLNRYDVEGISKELFESCISTVFSHWPTLWPSVGMRATISKPWPRWSRKTRWW